MFYLHLCCMTPMIVPHKVLSSQIHLSMIMLKACSHNGKVCICLCILWMKYMHCCSCFLLGGHCCFQEVYFNHTLMYFQLGVCCSVTSLQNTYTVAVLDNYRFHSISVLVTEILILWWLFTHLYLVYVVTVL
jgi:hypothetical protein